MIKLKQEEVRPGFTPQTIVYSDPIINLQTKEVSIRCRIHTKASTTKTTLQVPLSEIPDWEKETLESIILTSLQFERAEEESPSSESESESESNES